MVRTLEQPCVSRREIRRNDRRDTILKVARATFLDHGYAATTMSGIAEALGGSKATLWSYFPSKMALFEAVLDNATIRFRDSIASSFDPGDDLKTNLRRFSTGFLKKATRPEVVALHRLVQAEAGRYPECGRIFEKSGPRRIHAMLAPFLAEAMRRGILRRDDPMEASRLLSILCTAGCQQQLLFGVIDAATPEMIAADADAAVDLFLCAYAPDEGAILN